MRLGFMTALFPELSLEEVMDFAAREGFASIEVMCWPPGRAERKFAGVSHIDVTSLDNGGADKVTELCERTGVVSQKTQTKNTDIQKKFDCCKNPR